jgi:hypothetical protein
MPIRPDNRWLYLIDWAELSSLIRFERAKGRCERCRRPHLKIIKHLGLGPITGFPRHEKCDSLFSLMWRVICRESSG